MKSTCQYMISQHLMRQTSPFLLHCSQTFQVAAGVVYMFVGGLKKKSSYCRNNHCAVCDLFDFEADNMYVLVLFSLRLIYADCALPVYFWSEVSADEVCNTSA